MRKTLTLGLTTLIPVVIACYTLIFVINLLASPFLFLSKKLLDSSILLKIADLKHHALILEMVSKFLAILLLGVVSYLLGLLARKGLKKIFIDKPLNLLKRLPLIGWVISLSSNLANKFFDPKNPKFFKKTVLLPFFDSKSYALGFVTQETVPLFAKTVKTTGQIIFIPSSPHPISGFVVLTDSDVVTLPNLSPEDALNYIMSCGSSSK